MNIYQVVFDDPGEKETKEIVQYVGGSTLERVAEAMSRRAVEMECELRMVRWWCAVSEVAE